ncbi:MAG TPA: hypothetical protein VLB44_08930 [Kofleriaceae bacterium]|nr:hypothetical protein [Kofleriaceae bacterium]
MRKALEVSAGTLGLVLLRGCGGGGGGDTGGGTGSGSSTADCLANGTRTAIATNHGHVLVVSMDDVAEGADKAYDIRGSADHGHTVTITAQQFNSLAENQAIMMESSLNASASFGTHEHTVMVACV